MSYMFTLTTIILYFRLAVHFTVTITQHKSTKNGQPQSLTKKVLTRYSVTRVRIFGDSDSDRVTINDSRPKSE